jgi:hypothetical protein
LKEAGPEVAVAAGEEAEEGVIAAGPDALARRAYCP